MKKFICIILICLLLPITSLVFTGCKDKKYDLTKFYSSYQAIADKTQNLILVDANNTYLLDVDSQKIDIDYSKSSRLSSLVDNNNTPYYYLKHLYQQLLDDTLSPVYFFGGAISSSKKVSNKQTKNLFENLNKLEQDYIDIDYYMGLLINSLNATNDQTINLSHLKKVLLQYEEAIITASTLSAITCDIYFNTILSNSTFDYSNTTYDKLTEGDLTTISVNVRARMHYYKSVYANIYNQTCLRDSEIIDKLISSPNISAPNYQPYTYISNINALNGKPVGNLINDKTSVKIIYDNAIALFKLQNNFDEAYSAFNTSTSKIKYLDLNSKSTINEINYGNIIIGFANGIAFDSYEIIKNLVTALYL